LHLQLPMQVKLMPIFISLTNISWSSFHCLLRCFISLFLFLSSFFIDVSVPPDNGVIILCLVWTLTCVTPNRTAWMKYVPFSGSIATQETRTYVLFPPQRHSSSQMQSLNTPSPRSSWNRPFSSHSHRILCATWYFWVLRHRKCCCWCTLKSVISRDSVPAG
jgi:hypothetical protein